MSEHKDHHLHYPESDKAVTLIVVFLTIGPSIWIALALGFRGMAGLGMAFVFAGSFGGIAFSRRKIARRRHQRRSAAINP